MADSIISAGKPLAYLAKILAHERAMGLVWEERLGIVDGFILGNVIAALSVCDPGGPTCMVDDYWARGSECWDTIGQALLGAVCVRARSAFGAAQVVVVREHKDIMKRIMLHVHGLEIAFEWYVKGLK